VLHFAPSFTVNSGGFDSPEMTYGLTPATRFGSIRRSSRLTESGDIGDTEHKHLTGGRIDSEADGQMIVPGTPWHLGHVDTPDAPNAAATTLAPNARHSASSAEDGKRQGYVGITSPPRRPPARALDFFDTAKRVSPGHDSINTDD
jgi:hypothetical protein